MAIPHPDRELERLRQTVRGGLPPVALVLGPNAFFRRQAVAELLAAVPQDAELRTVDGLALPGRGDGESEGGPEPGGEAVDAPAASAPVELQDLRAPGLFSRRNYLCVRRGDRWLRLHGDAVAATVPRIGQGCGLILEVERLDKRTRASKALLEASAAFEFRDLYPTPFGSDDPLQGELVKWIQQRGRTLGLPLQPEAALLVMNQVGTNLAELQAELERLRDQIPEAERRRPLGVEPLRGRVSVLFDSTQFELADALLAGDRARALRSVHALFDRGLKGRDGRPVDAGGVFPMVASWLYQSLANALQGRTLLDAGVPRDELAARAGVRQFQQRFLQQVLRNDAATLRSGILRLLECQRLLRLCGEEPEALLERYVQAWFLGRDRVLPGAVPW